VHVNFVNDNARVGLQAREVVITGGLTLGGPPAWHTPPGGDTGPRPRGGSAPGGRIQVGTRNVAGDGDVIGVQARDIRGGTPGPADREGDGQ
jgi:hypothetical protein